VPNGSAFSTAFSVNELSTEIVAIARPPPITLSVDMDAESKKRIHETLGMVTGAKWRRPKTVTGARRNHANRLPGALELVPARRELRRSNAIDRERNLTNVCTLVALARAPKIQTKFRYQRLNQMKLSAVALPFLTAALVVSPVFAVDRPVEYPVTFEETDFEAKPWLKEIEWVIVVNRANEGADKQSVRIYHDQKLVTYEEIRAYLQDVTSQQLAARIKDPNLKERGWRVDELAQKQWAPGVFKVSTGRNQFEAKGEHHSQHASWTVTPTGVYVPQRFVAKHKSESYSAKMCDSLLGKVVSAVTRKVLCTYMENATFFNGGIALHKAIPGTEPVLGEKASGGCVRLPAALAEFLFKSLQQSQGRPVPVVNPDGTVQVDPQTGDVVRETSHKSTWGTIPAASAIIIVQDKIVQ
jgi:lipoprotein-anchoring transpeptidase ErfK/SrfK